MVAPYERAWIYVTGLFGSEVDPPEVNDPPDFFDRMIAPYDQASELYHQTGFETEVDPPEVNRPRRTSSRSR